MVNFRAAALVVCVLGSVPSFAQTRLYVNANLSAGANDGSSWENAFRGRLALQAALAAAPQAAEIWVARGIYAPPLPARAA